MAKIIQIFKDEQTNKIIGLGDDGVVYEAGYDGGWVESIPALAKAKNSLPATTQKRSAAFKPPSLLDVTVYMNTEGLHMQAATQESGKFMDFYESKGWMVGKNKMKNWKAAVRNWLKNYKPSSGVNMDDTNWINTGDIL